MFEFIAATGEVGVAVGETIPYLFAAPQGIEVSGSCCACASPFMACETGTRCRAATEVAWWVSRI